ncbi:helix-turn-helix domain-containing protein [Enterococcus faecalis]|uniref:helix-turn-helix domain-containing protein n=3 Tax=Enterococcus faecalis TaxID=1351 RepID=UPI0035EC9B66
MIRLIYENSLRFKVNIVRRILENNGTMTKSELLLHMNISQTTLEKYLSELYRELPAGGIICSGNDVKIVNTIVSLYEVQIFYLSNSIVKEIIQSFFFDKKITLEKLAQKIFVSPSKLFNVLKFLEKPLAGLNLTIVRSPYILLQGSMESVLILYNLLLQISENPYELSFFKYSKNVVEEKVTTFFEGVDIKSTSYSVKEMSLWIIAISDLGYMKHLIIEDSLSRFRDSEFISLESPVIKKMKYIFNSLNIKLFNEETCLLLLILLIFNTTGLHFNSYKSEKKFFSTELVVNFSYKFIIFEIFINEKYKISPNDANILAVKTESCLHFFSILAPYFCLYREFFSSNVLDKRYFKELVEELRIDFGDFNSLMVEDIRFDIDIYKLLAYVVSSCQSPIVQDGIVTLGVYSFKGSLFEERYCEELKNAIRIVPCYKIEDNEFVDILMVDDLRLLDSSFQYKDYLLLGNINALGRQMLKRISEKIANID